MDILKRAQRTDLLEVVGDPTLADAILDCLLHNVHKVVLKGESMRKNKQKLPTRERLM